MSKKLWETIIVTGTQSVKLHSAFKWHLRQERSNQIKRLLAQKERILDVTPIKPVGTAVFPHMSVVLKPKRGAT